MRAHYLDSLRGLAVLWMILFHGAYDLRIFKLIDWDFSSGFWFGFPRVIAFTFLFCVGLSLHYGHSPKVNWSALKIRSIKLGLTSMGVSLATYLIFPKQWIFFGTLHCILLGSLLGALIVNKKRIQITLLALILSGQYLLGLDIKWVSSIIKRPSMDFIPLYPWFWAIILGMLVAPFLSRVSWISRIPPNFFLSFLGQHSLKIYLIHQPILFGVIWSWVQVKSS